MTVPSEFMKNKEPEDSALTKGSILFPIFSLAMPSILVMALQIIITISEFYVISRLGKAAVAGAALVIPLQILMSTMSAGGIGNGISSALARALGSSSNSILRSVTFYCFFLGTLAGGLFYIALNFISPSFYISLGGSVSINEAAIQFSSSLAYCAFPLWISNLLASTYRGLGKPVVPSIVTSLTALVLFPAFPVFVFGWGIIPAMGIAGIGWALTLYYTINTIALTTHVYFVIARESNSISVFSIGPLISILRVGLPSCLNAIQNSILSILLAAFAIKFGVNALAAYGIASRLEAVTTPFFFGFASAVLTLTGINYGARNFHRARSFAIIGSAFTTAFISILTIFIVIWPEVWFSLFTSENAVFSEGELYLQLTSLAYPLFALSFVLGFAIQGTGFPFWPMFGVGLKLLVTWGVCSLLFKYSNFGFNSLAIGCLAGAIAQALVCISALNSKKIWPSLNIEK